MVNKNGNLDDFTWTACPKSAIGSQIFGVGSRALKEL